MTYTTFDENFSLANKVAMVTGAADGIGKSIALMFARKGADIILVDINKDGLKNVAKVIASYGKKTLEITTNLTETNNLGDILKKTLSVFSQIDILVNSAGVAVLDEAKSITPEAWDKTMDINLRALFFLSQLIGNKMIQQKKGKIINIASQAAIVALDKHVAYNASKAAVVSVTKVLAYEWAKFNIQVNAISPTVILTELGKKAWDGEVGEYMKNKIPAGRFGYPEEVAAAAVFLASDAANLITGENLIIDGGYTIQ